MQTTAELNDFYAQALGYRGWEDFCRAYGLDPTAVQVCRWQVAPSTIRCIRSERTGTEQQTREE
jgi:hypothetical protein